MATIKESKVNWDVQLALLESHRNKGTWTASTDGAAFDGFFFDEITTILSPFIEYHPEIPGGVQYGIFSKGFWAAAKLGSLTKEALISSISDAEHEYLRKPKKDYLLVSTINLPSDLPAFTVEVESVIFSFDYSIEIEKMREGLELTDRDKDLIKKTKLYMPGTARVSARDDISAFEQASRASEILRAFWNMFSSSVRVKNYGSFVNEPVNVITLGPVHTLHEISGQPIKNMYWYEPIFETQERRRPKLSDFQVVQKASIELLKKLENKNLREFISDVAIRYCRALDSYDRDSSFLKLWSALEMVTCTTPGVQHAEAIRRAAFIYADREQMVYMLEHLRERRNKFVHLSKSVAVDQTPLYQLRQVVTEMILTLIGEEFNFKTTEELTLFLEAGHTDDALNVAHKKLTRRLEILDFAKKYRKPKVIPPPSPQTPPTN